TNSNTVDVLAPSLAQADAIAAKMRALPEVARAITLSNFVPPDQDEKLPLIENTAKELAGSLNPTEMMAAPTDAENIAALTPAAQGLTKAGGSQDGPGAGAARRLSGDLTALARAEPAIRARADAAFVPPLKTALDGLRAMLSAQKVTL